MAETQAAAGTAAAETGKPAPAPAEPPTTHESKDSQATGGGGATAPAAASAGGSASGAAPGSGPAGGGSGSGGSGSAAPAAGSDGSAGGASNAGSADAAGRSVVGRASVPLEKSNSGATATQAKVIAKYTRAPGMVPPPETPTGATQGAGPGAQVSTGATTPQPVAGARPPQPSPIATVSTPTPASPAVARVTVRPSAGQGGVQTAARPTGATTSTNLGTVTQTIVNAPASTGPSAPAAAGAVASAGAARVTEAVRAARATVSAAAGRSPRRARLNLKRIDPWSVMKFSFAVSFVLFVVIIVATSVLYLALDAMGVFESVNKALAEMVGATGGDGSGIKITAKGVIGGAGLIGLVNVVLFTALATLSAFVYNVCADLVGGLELTLAERE